MIWGNNSSILWTDQEIIDNVYMCVYCEQAVWAWAKADLFLCIMASLGISLTLDCDVGGLLVFHVMLHVNVPFSGMTCDQH